MSETRPSGLSVVESDAAVVVQEVAELDERGRLHLLPRWVSRVDWLNSAGKNDIDALMVLIEPGLIAFHDWKVDGPRIAKRYKDIATSSDADAFEALRLIEDRYCRVKITKDRRPHLGDAALAHLGLPIKRSEKSLVYVVIYPNRIEILSPAFRNAKLISGTHQLDDLP